MNNLNLNKSFEKFKAMTLTVNKTVAETIEIEPGYYKDVSSFFYLSEDGNQITKVYTYANYGNITTETKSQYDATYKYLVDGLAHAKKTTGQEFFAAFNRALELIQNACNIPELV